MSHGVLAKLVAELLDEQSQLSGGLRLLLQELVAEAGNVLLDLLQLTYDTVTHTDTPIRTREAEQMQTCKTHVKCTGKKYTGKMCSWWHVWVYAATQYSATIYIM